VNTARGAAREVLDSNQRTMDAVRNFALEQKKTAARMQIFLVDMSTGEHAPELCNVGVAFDAGGWLACDVTREDGVIFRTDADTLLADEYLSTALRFFRSHPEISAASGNMKFRAFSEENRTSLTLHHMVEYFIQSQRLTLEGQFLKTFVHPQDTTMSGANMTFRPGAFVEAGGIEHVAGGEDGAFNLALLSRGLHIAYVPGLDATTDWRTSDRTDPDCSLGAIVSERMENGRQYARYPVLSLETHKYITALICCIDTANVECTHEGEKFPDQQEWKSYLSRNVLLRLSCEEIDMLWKENTRCAPLQFSRLNGFLTKAIYRTAEKYFPKIPFTAAIEELKTPFMAVESELDDTKPFLSAATETQELFQKMMRAIMKICRLSDRVKIRFQIPVDDNEFENCCLKNEVDFLNEFALLRHNLNLVSQIQVGAYQLPKLVVGEPWNDVLEKLQQSIPTFKRVMNAYLTYLYIAKLTPSFEVYDETFLRSFVGMDQEALDLYYEMDKKTVKALEDFRKIWGDFQSANDFLFDPEMKSNIIPEFRNV
ncbi:MAG: hypothetical protein AABZ32_01505, partial [Bacteroidota bacterium]